MQEKNISQKIKTCAPDLIYSNLLMGQQEKNNKPLETGATWVCPKYVRSHGLLD